MFFPARIKPYPFVRLLAALIAGIVAYEFFPSPSIWFRVAIVTYFISIVSLILYRRKRFIINWIKGYVIIQTLFFAGIFNTWLHHFHLEEASLELKEGGYLAKVTNIPGLKKGKWKCTLQLAGNDSGLLVPAIRIQAYFMDDSLKKPPRPGDWLLVSARPMRLTADGNPGAFDYAAFMANKGMYYQASFTPESWTIIPGQSVKLPAAGILGSIVKARLILIEKLHASGLSPPVQAFISALILGYKDELDAELKANFTSIGVVHVLAVSGLHVGIVYLILEKLFYFLVFIPGGKWLRFSLIFISLWFYVFLAGFSASVFRAALMFSFVLISRQINRDSAIYNSIASSAFVILILNPLAIFELGFLFSYLAVFGIVLLQSFMSNLLVSRYKLVNKLWSLMTLSFTAQLLVTPLSLYYFHTFPVWFIPANLVMVPLVVSYMYPAALALLLPSTGLIPRLLHSLLETGYQLIQFLAAFFDALPFAQIQQISLDSVQLLILYVLLIAGVYFLLLKIPNAFLYVLSALAAFIVYSAFADFRAARQQELVVFNTQGGWLISIIQGKSAEVLSYELDSLMIDKKLSPYLLQQRISDVQSYVLQPDSTIVGAFFEVRNNYLFWKGKSIQLGFLTKAMDLCEFPGYEQFRLSAWPRKKIPADYRQIVRSVSISEAEIPLGDLHCLSTLGAWVQSVSY
ncbi:MAG: ComEC family competence protein [Bacteroidales bacterium]|nr:ComEC family competence protein [Bacteroidales bacterium]